MRFIKNIIKEIRYRIDVYIWEKNYRDIENAHDFIYGIKSDDDFSGSEANLFTMNDLDICLDKETNKYHIGLETIYYFENVEDSKNYLKSLLSQLEKWMIDNNYNINTKVHFIDFYTTNKLDGFDSIEEAYAYLKLLINGYCNQ